MANGGRAFKDVDKTMPLWQLQLSPTNLYDLNYRYFHWHPDDGCSLFHYLKACDHYTAWAESKQFTTYRDVKSPLASDSETTFNFDLCTSEARAVFDTLEPGGQGGISEIDLLAHDLACSTLDECQRPLQTFNISAGNTCTTDGVTIPVPADWLSTAPSSTQQTDTMRIMCQ